MSDETTASDLEAIRRWLERALADVDGNRASSVPSLPTAFAGRALASRRCAVDLPAALSETDDGTPVAVEIRDADPAIVFLGANLDEDGVWRVAPENIRDLVADVPAAVALPCTVTVKAVFADADGARWTEVAGVELTETAPADESPPATAAPASPPATSDEMAPPQPPDAPDTDDDAGIPPAPAAAPADGATGSMSVIDLDVSVGIEDEDTLKDIRLTFSGLPEGARLSAGTAETGGSWALDGTMLDGLAILIPEGTGDFELTVKMDAAGEVQTASIPVAAASDPAASSDTGCPVAVTLAPPRDGTPTRLKLFADGVPVFDRVVTWSGDDATPVLLELRVGDETALPFEILIRNEESGAAPDSSPVFLGIAVDDTAISPFSPAIAGRSEAVADGLAWQGDLIVDVRRALSGALPASPPTPGDNIPPPTPGDDIPPPPEPADAPPQDAGNDLETARETPSPAAPAAGDENDHAADAAPEGVLEVDASFDDLQSPAFIDELRRLRTFIRAHAEGKQQDVYNRLGIDVGKWTDMSVRGPYGAPVELEPDFPALAVPGGRDNARGLYPVRLPTPPSPACRGVALAGVPMGGLLTHGRNLGGGAWHLTLEEAETVCVLGTWFGGRALALGLRWLDADGAALSDIPETHVLAGAALEAIGPERPAMTRVRVELPADVFDPAGYDAVSVTVGDVPVGCLLGVGNNHGGGVWTVETPPGRPIDMAVGRGTPPFRVTVTGIAVDESSGESTVVTRHIDVDPATGHGRLGGGPA